MDSFKSSPASSIRKGNSFHNTSGDGSDDSTTYSRQEQQGGGSKYLHDDSDLSNDAVGQVGKGLQRNLEARHLTMISLGELLLLHFWFLSFLVTVF